jgi:FtsX-like permease family
MRAVLAWLRLDARRRWRSLAVLALLVAVSSGTVLAAVAGARRGDSVLQRLTTDTLPATAVVLPNQPGFDWDRVRAMPEVEALSTFLLGVEFPIEPVPPEDHSIGFPPGDDEVFRTIELAHLVAGRLPDPTRADEAVITPRFATHYHLRLGDTVTALLYTPEQVRRASKLGQSPGPPAGPRVRMRIVGIGRTPWGQDTLEGGLLPSPGLALHYRANFYDDQNSYTNALVRLRGGEAALPAFQAHLAALTRRADIDVWNRPAQLRQQQRSFSFQARCLLAFGGAALVAAIVLVGQAIARYTAASVVDLQVVRALGMTPWQAVRAAAAGPFLAALAGATVGVLAAGVASRWFPIGSAALAEPAPGMRIDATVLGAGWAAIPLAVLVWSLAAGWVGLVAQRRSAVDRRSAVATAATRAGLPVPVVVGTRFALETGRGRTAVPVRPALFGAVAGVLGVVGVFTFSSGVSDAAANPARFGQTWQLGAFLGYNSQDIVPSAKLLAAVAHDPDVSGVDDAKLAVAHGGSADTAVTLFTYQPVGRPLPTVLTAGRLPASDSEVVLAPGSADALRTRLGGQATFVSPTGTHRLTVVGIGFVPSSPHNDYNNGGWLTSAGYGRLFGSRTKFHFGLIALRHGADPAAVKARLEHAAKAVPGAEQAEIEVAETPDAVAELRQVRQLPVALGIFLLLLAVASVGHALATAVRRRRLDVAVLRALGMTRRQCRAVVVTQASVLAVAGLGFGIPLGMALGRQLWRAVADYTPLQYVPPMALIAVLLVGPLALLVANALAAWPGHQAARLRIGNVLRAE